MEPPEWTVLRCSSCSMCFGRRVGTQGRCRRCGILANDSTEVVSHAMNVEQLQKEIGLANIPEDLREDFLKKVQNTEPVRSRSEDDPRRLKECLLLAAESGTITIDSVAISLARMNIRMNAIDLIEMGHEQGLLLKISEDEWQVLD